MPVDPEFFTSPTHETAECSEATSGPESMIRVGIFLVDDHGLLARSIAVTLGLDPQLTVVVVETSPDVDSAQALPAALDVAIFDRLSLAAQLREKYPDTRLLALGATEDLHLIHACIRAGVHGYTSMQTSPATLVDVIKRISRSEVVYETRALLELLYRPRPAVVNSPRRTAGLAKRELEVLAAAAMGLSTVEAADYLGISTNTLRSHLKNILVKLDARSKLEAVIIAIREGRIELPEDPG